MEIQSGDGNSHWAGVTNDNRLKVSSISAPKEHEINHKHGRVYSLGVNTTPTGANDCFLYMKNNSETDMIISEFMLRAVTSETIYFKIGDSGTPINGTVITAVNRNAGSGNAADITSLYGVDITELSGGSSVMSVYCKGDESSIRIAPLSGFIIPRNKIFTGYVSSGSIGIVVGMGISFHNSLEE